MYGYTRVDNSCLYSKGGSRTRRSWPELLIFLCEQAQLLQRVRVMLHVSEYFAKSLKIIRSDTLD